MKPINKSPLLSSFPEIKHGFLTREFENNQRQGISVKSVCRVKQVHGKSLFELTDEKDVSKAETISADILVTSLKQVALCILTADCVPLLFYAPKKGFIAAAHAGWKGTQQKVAQETIKALTQRGASTEEMVVALGPSIHSCCYEVDAKVKKEFKDDLGFKAVPEKSGHWMLDLQVINQAQLLDAGIPKEQLWISAACTACETGTYFSYRKEHENAGRQWSYIAQ
jgi:polyphenol oxidase